MRCSYVSAVPKPPLGDQGEVARRSRDERIVRHSVAKLNAPMRIRRNCQGCVGEGFYPSRRHNTTNLYAPMRTRMRRNVYVFDSASCAGGAEPLPYGISGRFYKVAEGAYKFVNTCCTIPQSASLTAPFTQGSLWIVQTQWCGQNLHQRAGQAPPLHYDE